MASHSSGGACQANETSCPDRTKKTGTCATDSTGACACTNPCDCSAADCGADPYTQPAQTCADAVDIQGDPVRHMLPLNAPVDVKVTAPRSGELAFACPMNMFRGAIVVVAQ